MSVTDVAKPIFRPSDPLDKLSCLAKWKVYACDPRTSLAQLGFECRKLCPSFEINRLQNVPIESAAKAGHRLPRTRAAREVDPENVHLCCCLAFVGGCYSTLGMPSAPSKDPNGL